MLDAFFRIHDFLVAHAHIPTRRRLMDEINWDDRLIAIKGGRGVGKTDFLLARARDIEEEDRRAHMDMPVSRFKSSALQRPCLYVNLNNFYFTSHSLVDFAGAFVKAGGKYLLVDQTFKYPNWSKELRKCHDKFRDLHIVFCASSVMRLVDENRDLASVVRVYNLRGFSFREFLSIKTGLDFPSYTLEEVMRSHASISREISERVNPLDYFPEYLRHGYYPSFLEQRNFEEHLLQTMNMILEIDVLIIKQIEVSNLPKLRKLLHEMLTSTPCALNVSTLSDAISTSRATTMNYIKYLKDARLLNLLYLEGKQFPMKPQRVYMQNPNIAYMCAERDLTPIEIFETYFYTAMHVDHKVNATERNAMFVVDNKYYFDVKENVPSRESIRPTAVGTLQLGRGNLMPLWILGFLY